MSLEESAEVQEATRQLTALEGAVRDIIVETAAGKFDPETAIIRGEILSSLWKDGNATLLRLEALTGPHPRRSTFTEAYATAKRALLKAQEGMAPPPLDVTLSAVPSRSDHLPRIELPKFNGSPSEWPAFAGRFEKRVAGLIDDANKYAFLSKCFERCGIARNSCEAFENAGMPFPQAWRKLEERFYKKRVAFLGHIRQILELPSLATASASGLMKIIDVVETSIASAKQIAGETEQAPTVIEDGLIVSIVLGKLDDDTKERISRRLDSQTIPTWKELREELDRLSNQTYYELRKKVVSRPTPNNAPTRPVRTVLTAMVRLSAPKPATSSTPVASSKSVPGNTGIRRCYECDKTGHVGTLCPELRVRSAIERINFVMDQGKCLNCLSRSLTTAVCPSEKRCQSCKKKHHTLLHFSDDLPQK
uniref:CCHC-type domain-containing protein n=1 Tax=Anopheles epiroticus TaxID=199890 RepID=A0A182PX37_9DIPT